MNIFNTIHVVHRVLPGEGEGRRREGGGKRGGEGGGGRGRLLEEREGNRICSHRGLRTMTP